MGLGSFGGGVGAARFLANRGAQVTVTDLADADQLADSLAQLDDLPITYHLAGHRDEDFTTARTDLIVANPAVPCHSPYLTLAHTNAVPVTAEICLFFQLCPAPIIGVTGTNGKSTTCAMIAACLEKTAASQDRKLWLGGNIGARSLLENVDRIDPHDFVIVELSSFQLYHLGRLQLSPPIAVLTNLTPNHLDWHGDMQSYTRAKQNILRFQHDTDHAILNQLEPAFRPWPDLTPAAITWYPAKGQDNIDLRIPGRHNQLNAAAALTVARVLSADEESARDALKQFSGLPHRLEFIAEIDGVHYYNDSIATTPASVIAAITTFTEPKVLILGGYDKKIPLDTLAQDIVADGTAETALLIGQVRDELASQIENAKRRQSKNLPKCIPADNLPQAVAQAQNAAHPGMIILLSPGCASYDMFKNFQHRGNQFRTAVKELAHPKSS